MLKEEEAQLFSLPLPPSGAAAALIARAILHPRRSGGALLAVARARPPAPVSVCLSKLAQPGRSSGAAPVGGVAASPRLSVHRWNGWIVGTSNLRPRRTNHHPIPIPSSPFLPVPIDRQIWPKLRHSITGSCSLSLGKVGRRKCLLRSSLQSQFQYLLV